MNKKEKLARDIVFRPAYDKRHSDPMKNYGISGVDILFILKGEKGAVSFVIFTGWHLPHIEKDYERKGLQAGVEYRCSRPMPADLGYHSIKKLHNYLIKHDKCEFTRTGYCYYDGSTMNAQKPFDILVRKGGEALWKYLEKYYRSVFDKVKI